MNNHSQKRWLNHMHSRVERFITHHMKTKCQKFATAVESYNKFFKENGFKYKLRGTGQAFRKALESFDWHDNVVEAVNRFLDLTFVGDTPGEPNPYRFEIGWSGEKIFTLKPELIDPNWHTPYQWHPVDGSA